MKRIRDLDLEGIVARVFHATDATKRVAVDNLIQMQLSKTPAKDRAIRLVRNHLALALVEVTTDAKALTADDPLVRAFIRTQNHPDAGALPELTMKNGVDASPHLASLVAAHPDLEWEPDAVQALILESIRRHGDHEVDDALAPWLMDWGPAVAASPLFRLVTLRKLGDLPDAFDVHEKATFDEAADYFERTKNSRPSNLVELLAAVIDAPTDPAPRRAYADAVRPTDRDRAELIDLQLAIREARRAGQKPPAHQTNRARAIAHNRGKAWAGKLATLVEDVGYYGGFVEQIRATPAQLAASSATLTKQAPIRHLVIRGLHGKAAEVAELPLLANLVSLDVNSNQLTDAEIAVLVASPHLEGLRVLRINNNAVGMETLRAIARALPDLRYVETSETEAPLIDRTDDAVDGSSDASFTSVQGALLTEFPNRAWLKALDEPHLDTL